MSRGFRISSCIVLALAATPLVAQEKIVSVDLVYRAPGNGPQPNFSPYGTPVKLTDLPAGATLPEGATRPARTGTVQVGPGQDSWIRVLATCDADHPKDLARLYVDRNRNGNFTDDGPPIAVALTENDKTKAWWESFRNVEFAVPYGGGVTEPYTVNFWAVREGDEIPGIIRFSVGSWRSGGVSFDGIDALVAVMDSNNDAIFNARDQWSVLNANEPDAARRVLTLTEARPSNRLMFLKTPAGKELVLEFRGLTPDGRKLTFAVVDRPVTKAADRAPDDTLAAERARPRTTQPFPWIASDFDKALALAKAANKKLIIDFWATWCGPCRSLDEWIFSDSEVAAVLNAGYVGLKLDADLEKQMVSRFHVEGYPTLIVLDGNGKEVRRFGYQGSKEMLVTLKRESEW